MKLKVIFILVLASSTLACARRPAGANYFVPPSCKPTLQLIGCDYSSPPHCQKVIARFRQGCEELVGR